jgi:uncharacterized membrane protein
LIVGTMDQSLRLLPEAIHPRSLLGFDIPGVGAILTLLIILVTGLLAANFIGQRLVVWWELLLARIPVVNSIYNSVKQVSDTLFSSSGNAFRKALLIEYPRRGSWTIAFLTGKPGGEMLQSSQGGLCQRLCADDAESDLGLLPDAAQGDVIELQMSVDTALKYVISMGVVAPPATAAAAPKHLNATSTIDPRNPENSMRTHYCGQVNSQNIGQEVTSVAGRIVAAITAASSSSTCATAKAWRRSSAIRTVR